MSFLANLRCFLADIGLMRESPARTAWRAGQDSPRPRQPGHARAPQPRASEPPGRSVLRPEPERQPQRDRGRRR